jgi:hypothetical protein
MKFRLALSLALVCGSFSVHAAPAPQTIPRSLHLGNGEPRVFLDR